MLSLILCFQVHQPYRLKPLNIFDIGELDTPFDTDLNRSIIEKIAEKCYIPANKLFLKLIERHEGQFKVSFSITGTAVEQLKKYSPLVLDLFVELAGTGCVQFIGETYYHSLSSLYDRDEFIDQIKMHLRLMQNEFGIIPAVFRNTGLIYDNSTVRHLMQFSNFQAILTEGSGDIPGHRSPLRPYRTNNNRFYLLLRNDSFSDDIDFRFSNRGWTGCPPAADEFISRIENLYLKEKTDKTLYLNLFLDYETFGKHGWEDFFEYLPEEVLKHENLFFSWPSDVIHGCNDTAEGLSIFPSNTRADTERGRSAWLSNDLQKNAVETIFNLLRQVKSKGDESLLGKVRKLTSSDHFYYMCTEYFQGHEMHKDFSPFDSPEDAYLSFLYAAADIEEKLKQ